MPFTGAGDYSHLPMSAPWTHNAANTSASDLTEFATPGAATWPPSATSSAVTSHMDSSAAAPTSITEINLVSSPPTNHATSPSRTRSSPLRPSLAANVLGNPSSTRNVGKAATALTVAQTEAYVANSDTVDEEHGGHVDGVETPQHPRSPSPPRSSVKSNVPAALSGEDHESSVYVQIPASTPSTRPPQESSSSKEKSRKQQTRRGSDASDTDAGGEVSADDDAAYAAALAAQEETLARRHPVRNARKEVSYIPNCDLDGRPLPTKKPKDKTSISNALSSASKLKSAPKDPPAAKESKNKRRSGAFSDDDDDGDIAGPSSSTKSKGTASNSIAESDDDLTDDDVGFKARDRKKAKVSKPISVISDDEDKGEQPARRKKALTDVSPRRKRTHDEDREASELNNEDSILTPPAPTSPRRSSRKGMPSPKKQQLKEATEEKKSKKGKGKSKQKTFDLDGEKDHEEEEQEVVVAEDVADEAKEDDEPPRKLSRKDAASRKGSKPDQVAPPAEEEEGEANDETKRSPDKPSSSTVVSTSSSKSSDTATSASPAASTNTPSRTAPTSVVIKRITTSASSSPSLSPSSPATARSFFGKPLTSILNSGAVRRPGLTRKTNIPSLLNHRGAPKPPAAKLAVSKRRMQDDDYEYDAEYEALIAKNKKGSDDEDDEESEGEAKEEAEIEVEEYD
ncbi:uncharacterized protein SPSC_05258 [Sporisorium scitamineum]|uniref:Uncharacterized protein n=1 Tax=Sporisorium scitamineum TaxID=49012 RepID=A0A127Z483_9BASI|nr:uncharacterized protein SPSC_05258 [Sporisorium scitamineum]